MSDKQRLHVDADRGLWIPPAFREFEGQIVFRTPKGTIQHWGSPLDPYYGFIRASSFGDVDDLRDPKNPHLAPNRVSIKRKGEDAVVFDVDVNDGEKQLIADGGRDTFDDGSPKGTSDTAQMPAANGDKASADLLHDVANLIDGDRDSHGDAVDQQAAAAEAWTWYLRTHGLLRHGESLKGSDVARMMQLLKMSRAGIGEYDIDHDRDSTGYGAIAAACAVREGDAEEAELTRGDAE